MELPHRLTVRSAAAVILAAFLASAVALVLPVPGASAARHGEPDHAPVSVDDTFNDTVPLRGTWRYRWIDAPVDSKHAASAVSGESLSAASVTPDGAAAAPLAIPSPSEVAMWPKFALPGEPPGRDGRTDLWLAAELPTRDFADPSIFLLAVNTAFEAYVDGKPVGSHGRVPSRDSLEFHGFPWFLLPLPADYHGRTLLMRVHSRHVNIGPFGEVWVGPRVSQLARLVRGDLPRFLVGAVISVLGLGLLIAWMRRREKIYLSFALFSASMGLYVICRSSTKQIIVDMPVAWFWTEVVCFFTIPFFMSLFTDVVFGRNNFSLLSRISSVYAVLALGAAGVGLVPLLAILLPFQILFLVCSASFIYELLKRINRGEFDPKVLALGFIALCLSGFNDIFVALGAVPWTVEISPIGLLGVVASMTAIIVRRIVDVHRRVESYARELEAKSIDLEEKNGSLVKMSEDLGTVAVKLGDHLNTPLQVMLLACEELEDHCDEKLEDDSLRSEFARLFAIFRQNTAAIHRELRQLAPFKKYAPRNALDEPGIKLESFKESA